LEWRAVSVTGEYDFEDQVALRNQYNGDQYGYHLVTPLLFDGRAVLVDRGWIPADSNSRPEDWRKYDEAGKVTVTGQIRLGQDKPAIGGIADPELGPEQNQLDVWNNLNVDRISKQISYPILSVYIQPNLDNNDSEPPIKFQPVLELTEGPHFGYALQWFAFATILFVGYPFYLRKQD
jgi:surfeit locus 1 family protein